MPAGPVLQGPLPHVPGYIPVYIQSGDSPPDVQRLYESQPAHRTLVPQGSTQVATRRVAQAAPPAQPAQPQKAPQSADGAGGEVRDTPALSAPSAPRQRPQADGAPVPAPAPARSRVPAHGVHKEAAATSASR